MTQQTPLIDRLVIAFTVAVSLLALLCAVLAPGFLLDNDLVYGGF